MSRNTKTAAVFIAIVSIALPFAANPKKRSGTRNQRNETPQNAPKVLWRKPADISARDLFYGPGGKEDQPGITYTFLKEDLKGSHPKFDVRDQNGVKWRAKLGAEARPETVASRLVWAVGYYTNEDYFLPVLRVRNMPRLQRGQNLVSPDGSITNLRLKRYLKDEKKIALWRWHRNPFVGTRELNGLRVMMALINNWDLKDDNNSVYEEQAGASSGSAELRYMVSDLGASFGTTGRSWTPTRSRGDLNSYRHSKFITKITDDYVDFRTPSRPALLFIFNPVALIMHLRLHWIGQHIPRSDAKWVGQLLAQLSPDQIGDAFRAAGYSPQEVDAFTSLVRERIDELSKL